MFCNRRRAGLIGCLITALALAACDSAPPTGDPSANSEQAASTARPAIVVTSAPSAPPATAAPLPTPTPPPPTTPPATRAPAPTSTEEGESAQVARVIDGDTIEVAIDGQAYRVRYIGVNTPEIGQAFGEEASAANAALVEGKTVRLVRDVSETDRYGRLLRYVYAGDVFVNAELVRQGYAYASAYPPDVKYADYFAQLQADARANGAGLWAPIAAEATQAVLSGGSACPGGCAEPPPGCQIKGNISSSGERIYHVPGGEFYLQTVITPAKGERWFCTEAEALEAGWRKSQR